MTVYGNIRDRIQAFFGLWSFQSLLVNTGKNEDSDSDFGSDSGECFVTLFILVRTGTLYGHCMTSNLLK